MYDISFGKFFDADKDHELIENMKLVKSENYHESAIYLFKNDKNGEYYAVLEKEPGGDIAEELKSLMGNHNWHIQEIPPKHSDWYVTHHMAHVMFDPC
jgi:hypothetical protein